MLPPPGLPHPLLLVDGGDVALAVVWGVWQIAVRHVFAQNVSEFYPRINWNVKSLPGAV